VNCRICGHAEGRTHAVREMMFGTGEAFHYWECAGCGCLQLIDPPADLSAYYPQERYYSLAQSETPTFRVPQNPLRRWLKRFRDAAILFQKGGLAGRVAGLRPNPGIEDIRGWLAPTAVRSWDAKILDIGCGSGELLFRLAALGFTSLVGVDPFLSAGCERGPVRIVAGPLESVAEESFDLVMFHHALEHIPDQAATLALVEKLLGSQGVCLVRIPIASDGPWKRYGTDWAEIDAPRHFFLHTETSLKIAAEACGLTIVQTEFEADPFPYAASELYRRGMSLVDVERGATRDFREVFTDEELSGFAELAEEDCAAGRAGRAAFFLRQMLPSVRSGNP
jgi:SAM-dependent methyltransferase